MWLTWGRWKQDVKDKKGNSGEGKMNIARRGGGNEDEDKGKGKDEDKDGITSRGAWKKKGMNEEMLECGKWKRRKKTKKKKKTHVQEDTMLE